MIRKLRTAGAVALMTGIGIVAAACGGGETTTTPAGPVETAAPAETAAPEHTVEVTVPAEGEHIPGTNLVAPLEATTITWWHNGTGEPLYSFWNDVAAEFEAAHPGVTVNVTAFQNEQLRDEVLANAFAGGGQQPDLFQSWGGGELRNYVNDGIVMNLDEVMAPTIHTLGAAIGTYTVDGVSYGLPYTLGPAGFWVNLNLMNEAGLVQNAVLDADGNVESGTVNWPTDFDGMFAMWETLREHNITPVAVGGGDGWAAAWWFYAMASKACSPAALTAAANHDFSDACWEQAGEDLQRVLDQNAFNDGWQATSAQQGATSSAGQVILGQAAMEFMGPWGGGVMSGIWHEQQGTEGPVPDFIAWYLVPAMPGGAGAGNLMAGGDGFSVLNPERGSQARSDAAAALLAYILSDDVQTRFVENQIGNPTNPAAIGALTNPIAINQANALAQAPFATLWLDTVVGSEVGNPMNNAIVAFMGGQGAPADIVHAMNTAAGN